MTDNSKINILFICLGNICRSPAANAVMQKMVDDSHLASRFYIDSAGIGGWHVGQLPDKRMRDHGAARGYKLSHLARQFDPTKDFRAFDLIVTMDEDNYHAITSMAPNDEERRKVVRMADYLSPNTGAVSVPDPYYGGPEDFERALDLIEDGCRNLLSIQNSKFKIHN